MAIIYNFFLKCEGKFISKRLDCAMNYRLDFP